MNFKTLCLLLYFTFVNSVPIDKSLNSNLKPFLLDDILDGKFSLKGFNASWVSDKLLRYFHDDGNIYLFNAETKTHNVFIGSDVLDKLNFSSLTVSKDQTQILFRYDSKMIFRHSVVAKYKIYNLNTKVWTDVADKNELQLCFFSPIDNTLAYVKDNDVYYRKSNGKELRLTSDGVPGIIYNGVPDWVYEEEVLSNSGALWFSPDGKKIAIASFNDLKVKEFRYNVYGEPGNIDYQYPTTISIRYPKPNTTNPDVSLRYIDLTKNNNTPTELDWILLKAPIEIVGSDHILASVKWSFNDNLLVTWLNRRQNKGVIKSCNTNTKNCKTIYTFFEPNGWIDVSTPTCNLNGSHCYFLNNYNGWRHIGGIQIETGEFTAKTSGQFTILNILGYKENTDELLYTATLPDHPEEQHVFRGNACLSCQEIGPEPDICTFASASFSKDSSYYSLSCLGPNPIYTKIFQTEPNTEILMWEGNPLLRESLSEYQNVQNHFVRVPVAGGFMASVKLILPPEINLNDKDTTTKYPMILYVYGGPNSVRVYNSFSIGFQNYLVTSRKVIYCIIDARGSGNKGTDMLFTINNKMGTVEVEDFIEVTKSLQKMYPFIDVERTSIWGWSYGGYATAMTLAKDKNRVFQCGISVAPVTSWIYYDSIYTERYMGLPTIEDNIIGYNESDVTRRVQEMNLHDFLLIHGTEDDNVHYQQAMALSRALQKASILFEQMSYPDEAHGLTGVQSHLYRTMDEFWTKCLNLGSEDE